ncbi:hypothetical protein [uncultured Capnocytophaga sp.]|uniref:hypothetical protein n=1 Tax=uncultured Capnocytophaga sp. TaxID=159273 RepID=UPI00261CF1CF|nr:hypothetical protein [uncultured Capnocytophaga sp.]
MTLFCNPVTSVVAEFYLRIVILPLVLERTPEILFSKALSGVAIKVLLAFPYQFTFLVVGFYGVSNYYNTVYV